LTNNFIGYSPGTVKTTDTIVVTATDSSTGLIYFVEVKNHCTQASLNYECEAVAGRDQVITSDYSAQMTDNGDNTYTYSTTVTRPGDITINVLKYTSGGAYSEFYTNLGSTGTNSYQNISTDINYNWGSGDVFPGNSDTVGAKFYFRVYAPASGPYTFYVTMDDAGYLEIDGNNIISVGS
jgi:hypothetical protein